MSKKYTIIVQKDKSQTIHRIPFKCLSMKQRQHLGLTNNYYIKFLNKTNDNENNINISNRM